MMLRTIAVLVAATVAACACGTAGRAQMAPVVWVQYEADGAPHVRAIVIGGGACPALTIGSASTQLAVRAPATNGFPDTVCDLPLPANAAGAHVGSFTLPAIPRAPQTIAIFGDTGCRLVDPVAQACNDPARWPFPAIVRDVAAAHPDLVIHVGDYHDRETPCPAGVNCAHSPHGDVAGAWIADYFAPMLPLFPVAPIVNVRGNHEDCARAPLGWTRYLSGVADLTCLVHEPPAFIAFDNVLLGQVDDARELTETLPAPPVFATDEALVDAHAVRARRETWLLVHRPPLAYEISHHGRTAGSHIAALVSGHIHVFGAYTLDGEPAQVITGFGGDNLAPDIDLKEVAPLGGVTDRHFGYALFVHDGNGWDITVHDVDTAVHRRCRLAGRTVTCGPALTAGTESGPH
jgi:hypothetical protein